MPEFPTSSLKGRLILRAGIQDKIAIPTRPCVLQSGSNQRGKLEMRLPRFFTYRPTDLASQKIRCLALDEKAAFAARDVDCVFGKSIAHVDQKLNQPLEFCFTAE